MKRIATLTFVAVVALSVTATSEDAFAVQAAAAPSLDLTSVAGSTRSGAVLGGAQTEGDGLYTPGEIRKVFAGSDEERVFEEQEEAINQSFEESAWLDPLTSESGGQANILPERGACTVDTYPGALYFESNRFLLVAAYTGFDHVTKLAGGTQFSDASGYFWFFGPDNAELVIKILYGCGSPPPGHWVFLSGLTNFSFTVRIVDRATGRQLDLSNLLGNTAQPYINQTFFSCP